jgi:WD40 repeat protein
LQVLTGHQSLVTNVCFNHDGSRLATSGDDGSVCLWNAISGAPLQVLTGHEGSVTSVCFNHDGSRLASSGNDGSVRLWDAATGEQRMVLAHLLEQQAACLTPDHQTILSATPSAWKYLRWLGTDPTTGKRQSLLAEMFGPLPPMHSVDN